MPEANGTDLKSSILQKINQVLHDDEYAFDAFILMKADGTLKKSHSMKDHPKSGIIQMSISRKSCRTPLPK